MLQCQNDWQAWHILQEKLGEKSGKLRYRCGVARTQAFQHGGLDMFTETDTQTHPHTDIHTHTSCLFHSFSQDVICGSGVDALNRTY